MIANVAMQRQDCKQIVPVDTTSMLLVKREFEKCVKLTVLEMQSSSCNNKIIMTVVIRVNLSSIFLLISCQVVVRSDLL